MKVQKKSIENLVESIYLQDYLKQFIEIKRSGNNAVSKCPFHQDSSPSLYIYPDHYHCFACNAHGNIIDYEMHRTGSSFREAILHLAETHQIQLEYEGKTDQKTFEKNFHNEHKNKILLEIFSYLKENTKSNIAHDFRNLLEFYDTGSFAACRNFFDNEKSIGIEENFDFSERLAFPVYKDNNKLCGFVFSNKFSVSSLGAAVSSPGLTGGSSAAPGDDIRIHSEKFFEVLSEHVSFNPLTDYFSYGVNWSAARSFAVKEKELYVVSTLRDLFLFLSIGIQNVVLCTQNNIDIYIAKIFSKRVPKVILALPLTQSGNTFLWNTFLNTIELDDLSVRVVFLPRTTSEILSFIRKFSVENFKKWLENSKTIYDEVTQKTLHKYPVAERLTVFKKNIFPILNKIEDNIRKKNIFSDLAIRHFGSTQDIFLKNSQTKIAFEPFVKATQSEPAQVINSLLESKNIMIRVVEFYHKILQSTAGIQAREYLQNRNISIVEIKKWKIGFCPFTNELAAKVEKNADASLTVLLELGLLKKSLNSKKNFDFFGGRIIIPIYDHGGLPVALSGRLFSGSPGPKYINSQESSIFSKSNILFNFYNALTSIINCGYVIVVEGYMDCISLVSMGITNVVAVMGTALTAAHMDSLVKLTRRIVICFDNDKAGQNAAKRTFSSAFFYPDVELEYLSIPNGKDPDEYIRNSGTDHFLTLISYRRSLLEQICDGLLAESKGEKEEFFQLIKKQVLPILARQTQIKIQNEAIAFICQKYFQNISPSDLQKEMGKSSIALADVPYTSSLKEIDDWPVKSGFEFKFLLSLVHLEFSKLPMRLKNVAQGTISTEEANESICALALEQQLTPASFSILLEILTAMAQEPHNILVSLTENVAFSSHVRILLAYARGDAYELLRYNLQELLKDRDFSQSSMVSSKNVWDPVNSGFLRFLLQNIRLFQQKNILLEFVAETLLKLELEYIDHNLKEVSSFHYNNDLSEQFQDLIKERARRLQEFSGKEAY